MKSKSIKESLPALVRTIMLLLLILIIPVHIWFELQVRHQSQEESAKEIFGQLEQVIVNNKQDILLQKEEHSLSCIQAAEIAAHFLRSDPEIPYSIEKTKQLAEKLDVDELHFFTPEGEIYAGTHPEYYGFRFDSGEQMSFFLPMLENHNLKLCQDIMPNTAEGKEMQYAAVWVEDGSQIIQVGVNPERVLSMMQDKSLEAVVSSYPFDFSGFLHVVDLKDRKIIASTAKNMHATTIDDQMFEKAIAFHDGEMHSFHSKYNGKRFCVYARTFGDYLLVRTFVSTYIIKEIALSTIMLVIYVFLGGLVIIIFIGWYIQKKVADNLTEIVTELQKIESGDLENITYHTGILEFDQLIYYVNQLLKTVRLNWRKVSEIIEKSGLPIGMFEYNHFFKKYMVNERMLELLGISKEIDEKECIQQVRETLEELLNHKVDEKEVVCEHVANGTTVYLRVEKRADDFSVTYYVTDVSLWWNTMDSLKTESSKDSLTSLLNRRGFYEKMDQLFAEPEKLGHAAIVMIDADGLKKINDQYGHYMGDEYLRQIGHLLNVHDDQHVISARLGGDEFVVCMFGYESQEGLLQQMNRFERQRGSYMVDENLQKSGETLEFSAGYAFYPGDGDDYHMLMRIADKKMYLDKKQRKSIR